MIIPIDKKERDLYERACAELNYECDFFSNEINPCLLMFRVEGISERIAFDLGRMVQMNWQDKMEKTYKREK